MERDFRKYDRHTDTKNQADYMKLCNNLLNRLIEDCYYNEENQMFERNPITQRMEQQDINLLFKTISKHIMWWWD
jgi:hypothetical protein